MGRVENPLPWQTICIEDVRPQVASRVGPVTSPILVTWVVIWRNVRVAADINIFATSFPWPSEHESSHLDRSEFDGRNTRDFVSKMDKHQIYMCILRLLNWSISSYCFFQGFSEQPEHSHSKPIPRPCTMPSQSLTGAPSSKKLINSNLCHFIATSETLQKAHINPALTQVYPSF